MKTQVETQEMPSLAELEQLRLHWLAEARESGVLEDAALVASFLGTPLNPPHFHGAAFRWQDERYTTAIEYYKDVQSYDPRTGTPIYKRALVIWYGDQVAARVALEGSVDYLQFARKGDWQEEVREAAKEAAQVRDALRQEAEGAKQKNLAEMLGLLPAGREKGDL